MSIRKLHKIFSEKDRTSYLNIFRHSFSIFLTTFTIRTYNFKIVSESLCLVTAAVCIPRSPWTTFKELQLNYISAVFILEYTWTSPYFKTVYVWHKFKQIVNFLPYKHLFFICIILAKLYVRVVRERLGVSQTDFKV